MAAPEPVEAVEVEQVDRPPAGRPGTVEPGGSAGYEARHDPARGIPAPPSAPGHRRLALLLAVAFVFGPAAAYAVGVRPAAIENRRLASFPSLSSGWRFFDGFSRWAIDHMPLRGQAVQANTTLSEQVFGTTPDYSGKGGGGEAFAAIGGPVRSNTSADAGSAAALDFPKVVQGRRGWLFLGGDVRNACRRRTPLSTTMARLDRLAGIVEGSGRRFVLTVPPDKTTMEPALLPGDYVGKQCGRAGRAALWQRLRSNPPAGYLDLRGPLEAAQRAAGRPIYRQKDSHWAPRGAAVYAEALADRLDRRLWATSRLVPDGTQRKTGDLTVLLGSPATDSSPQFALVRDGVRALTRTRAHTVNTTTGAPLFTPRTVIVGDSFQAAAWYLTSPLFREQDFLRPGSTQPAQDAVISEISKSQVVVVEMVERTVAGGDSPLLGPAFLDRLAAALAG